MSLSVLFLTMSQELKKAFECKSCDAVFLTASNLRRHVNAKHLNKVYDCHLCDKKFHRSDNRNRHMRNDHAQASKEAAVTPPASAKVATVRSVVTVPPRTNTAATRGRPAQSAAGSSKMTFSRTRLPSPPKPNRSQAPCPDRDLERLQREQKHLQAQLVGKDRCISQLKKDVTALQGQVDLMKREVELKDGEISRQAALLATFGQAMAQQQAGSISGQAQLTGSFDFEPPMASTLTTDVALTTPLVTLPPPQDTSARDEELLRMDFTTDLSGLTLP